MIGLEINVKDNLKTKLESKKLTNNISFCSQLYTQALIPLALEGTEAGKVKASHALAKIASISNPEIAFPGERVSQLCLPLCFNCSYLCMNKGRGHSSRLTDLCNVFVPSFICLQF